MSHASPHASSTVDHAVCSDLVSAPTGWCMALRWRERIMCSGENLRLAMQAKLMAVQSTRLKGEETP